MLAQGGFGVTEQRGRFKFFMAGVHAGKVLTGNWGTDGCAAILSTGWRCFRSGSRTRRLRSVRTALRDHRPGPEAPARRRLTLAGRLPERASRRPSCAGTWPGRDWAPWVQGAGGLVWTNHKYPAYGGPPVTPGDHQQQYWRQWCERRYQRVELYAAVRRGGALLPEGEALARYWCECDPHLQRVAGRQESRGERKRAVYGWIQLVEVSDAFAVESGCGD